MNTCKLFVSISTSAELADEFAVRLEDEDAAGFIIHYDDVPVSVHRHAFGTHQLPGADLTLTQGDTDHHSPLLQEDMHVYELKRKLCSTNQ